MQLVFVTPELCLFVSSCAFIAGVANVCEGEFGAGNHPCRNCTDQKREISLSRGDEEEEEDYEQ